MLIKSDGKGQEPHGFTSLWDVKQQGEQLAARWLPVGGRGGAGGEGGRMERVGSR